MSTTALVNTPRCRALAAAALLGLGALRGAQAAESEIVFDVAPLDPAAVAGELFAISSAAGHVVHGRIDATFVSNDPGPWTLYVNFALPTGIAGVDSQVQGWSGVGSFSTTLHTEAFNGALGPADGQSFYVWFLQWVGGTPFSLPGGGTGVGPVDGLFTELKLTLTFADTPPGAWTDLGHALAGQLGAPQLTGSGSLCRSAPCSLTLSGARPLGSAFLVLGFHSVWQPFKGGLLIPAPQVVFGGLPIDAAGEQVLPFSFPIGVPPGTQLWFQHWIPDPAAASGHAASNAVLATVPSDC